MSEPTIEMLDDSAEPLRVMYYGDPGSAKSTSMMAMAKLGRIVVIDADNGLKARALRSHGIPTENIEVHKDITYEGITMKLYSIQARLQAGEPIVGLVLDTATLMMPHLLDPIAARAIQKQRAKGLDTSDFEVSLDARGELSQMYRKLQRQWLGLPIHVAVGCHVRRDVDQETSVVRVGPSLPPALQSDVMALYDVICMTKVEEFDDLPEGEFSALTKKSGRFIAKDRFRVLPKTLIEPSFDRVLGYIEGTISKDKDQLQLDAIARRQPKMTAATEEKAA